MTVRDCNHSCVRNGIIIGDKIDRRFQIQEEKAVEHSYGSVLEEIALIF